MFKALHWNHCKQTVAWVEGGQESEFHSLFFMQASVIASIIYLHYNCLLYVQVFVHEAIQHAELNIYFNNQHLLINISHNINTELQSSNT